MEEQVFTYFTTVVIIYQTVFHSLENTREKVVIEEFDLPHSRYSSYC